MHKEKYNTMKSLFVTTLGVLALSILACKPINQNANIKTAQATPQNTEEHIAILHGENGDSCLATSAAFAPPSEFEVNDTDIVMGEPLVPTNTQVVERVCTPDETRTAEDFTRSQKTAIAQARSAEPTSMRLSKGQIALQILCAGGYILSKTVACNLFKDGKIAFLSQVVGSELVAMSWRKSRAQAQAASAQAITSKPSAAVNVKRVTDLSISEWGKLAERDLARQALARTQQVTVQPKAGMLSGVSKAVMRACLVSGLAVEGLATANRTINGAGFANYCGQK